MRALVLVALVFLSGLSSAQPRLGEAKAIAPDLLVPAPALAVDVAGVAVSDGYLVAWIENNAIRATRLDSRGEVVAGEVLTISAVAAQTLMVASNGADVVIGWTIGGSGESTWRLVLLTGGAKHTLTQRGIGSLDGLLSHGNGYLAIVREQRDYPEIKQLDNRGFEVSSEPLGISPASSDPATWRLGLFHDGAVAWLVTTVDGRPTRLALTDAGGKLQRPAPEPLGFELPLGHQLFSAGQVGGRWYVVYGEAEGRYYVRFLGFAAPIAIQGFTEIAHRATVVSGGELYLFGVLRGPSDGVLRGARVAPGGRVSRFDVARGTKSWTLGAVAARYGVLLLSANTVAPPTFTQAPAVARMIRPLGRGGRTFIRPPVVLQWARASQFEVAIAAHSVGFLAAWQQQSAEGMEVWSRLLDRDGREAGEPRRIGRGQKARIASNGDVALIVWSNAGAVEARRVDAAGVPLGAAMTLDRAKTAEVSGVGWDGVQFSVAWGTDTHLSTIALTSGGELLGNEPVRLIETPAGEVLFAVSPFGALLVYAVRFDAVDIEITMGLRLTRDLHAAGPPFEVAGIDSSNHQVVWIGDHYLVTLTHGDSLRAARVSASGESIDAPYGRWLTRTIYRHRVAYANGRVIAITARGGFTIDRELRTTDPFATDTLPYDVGALAIREDGAALVAYAASQHGLPSLAYVRTIP